MSQSGNNTYGAYHDINVQRFGSNDINYINHPYDVPLRDAEHYMFARDFTANTYGAGLLVLVYPIYLYNGAKYLGGQFGIVGPGLLWDTTPGSWAAVEAAQEGACDGVKDVFNNMSKRVDNIFN